MAPTVGTMNGKGRQICKLHLGDAPSFLYACMLSVNIKTSNSAGQHFFLFPYLYKKASFAQQICLVTIILTRPWSKAVSYYKTHAFKCTKFIFKNLFSWSVFLCWKTRSKDIAIHQNTRSYWTIFSINNLCSLLQKLRGGKHSMTSTPSRLKSEL